MKGFWLFVAVAVAALIGLLVTVGALVREARGAEVWPVVPPASASVWPEPPAEKPTPKPIPPATKRLRVIDTPAKPGRTEQRCIDGVCQTVTIPEVPATWREIEVRADLTPEGEKDLVRIHYRLGPPSCLMAGCVTCPRKQIAVDAKDVPVAEEDRKAEAVAEANRIDGQGGGSWYLGRILGRRRGR